jgi:hypothetical protein
MYFNLTGWPKLAINGNIHEMVTSVGYTYLPTYVGTGNVQKCRKMGENRRK